MVRFFQDGSKGGGKGLKKIQKRHTHAHNNIIIYIYKMKLK